MRKIIIEVPEKSCRKCKYLADNYFWKTGNFCNIFKKNILISYTQTDDHKIAKRILHKLPECISAEVKHDNI